jgi:hypothetical protein
MLTLDALMGSLKDETQYADVKRQLTELQKVPHTPYLTTIPKARALHVRLFLMLVFSLEQELAVTASGGTCQAEAHA